MQYRETIQKALDYIEENLKNEIDPAVLAKLAGYSEFHFLRIFKEVAGLTPADYIRKRRITEVVRRMSEKKRPIADIAFEYGFNSKENFVRAFKREHHILPSEFRAAQNSLKLCNRLILEPSEFMVQGRIVTLPSFVLIARKSDEDFPPHFWNRYNAGGWSKTLSGGAVVEDIGVSDYRRESGKLDYYIGIRESDARGDRTGTVMLAVDGGEYAVFEPPPAAQTEFVNTIHRTWAYIRVWLDENGYRRTGGYELESYTEESRLFTERIYIPIIKEGNDPS